MNIDQLKTRVKSESWVALSRATIGKDVLELLSSSMYVDPLTIYREYVQNAIDAIDEAREAGIYRKGNYGRIDVNIDLRSRSIRIRDDGIGVRKGNFETQLGTFGASLKRDSQRRGFRGVGRLAGLGYCQSLVFRTRAVGDPNVSEMLWDCRKIKKLLNTSDRQWSLEELLTEVVSIRTIARDEYPKHFFEVELSGVIRHKNDVLLNRRAIYDYLSEVAPVPFHPDFTFGKIIVEKIGTKVSMGNVAIHIDGEDEQIYRPFRDQIEVNGTLYDQFTDLEFSMLPALDEGESGLIWFLHHAYRGAIPDSKIKGLRIRCGNIQIGAGDIFADIFAESRFNSWTVGEIHVLDRRLTPNGRRDHFELGVHFDNLVNQIIPLTRKIGSICRKSSQVRHRHRQFDRNEAIVTEKSAAISQGLLGPEVQEIYLAEIARSLEEMRRLAASPVIDDSIRDNLICRIDAAQKQVPSLADHDEFLNPLMSVPTGKRGAYREVFGLIYECSDNHESARNLIDKILTRLR